MYEFFELNGIYYHKIEKDDSIQKHKINFPLANTALVEKSSNEGLLKGSFLDFYRLNDGMTMEWRVDPKSDESGRIKIAALEDFLAGVKGQLSYLKPEDDLYSFHPIDLFTDEASCGVFIKDGEILDRMHYNYFGEDKVVDLQLTFQSYLTLANLTRGYFYWPHYLIELIEGKSTEESENFKIDVPKIFSGFSLEGFAETFEKFRLK